MKTIWHSLTNRNKPFFVMAPLDNVTDTVFRRIVAKVARPDLFFTEFINADAYVRGGFDVVEHKLRFSSEERPLIAQIWGKEPSHYEALAAKVADLGFDGVDINMGCPEKKIVKNGCCAGLIREPKRAAGIITATKKGAKGLPVSVKTRLGFNEIITEEWVGFLLEQGLAALTIHGRTAKEMSKVEAHWDEIAKAVQLRNRIAPQTVIVGNGDVYDIVHGRALAQQYGVDGVMIGRGVFQNITAFSPTKVKLNKHEKLDLLLEHLDLYQREWQEKKRFEPLKKFFKIYVNGFEEAAKLRAELMAVNSYQQAKQIVDDFLK